MFKFDFEDEIFNRTTKQFRKYDYWRCIHVCTWDSIVINFLLFLLVFQIMELLSHDNVCDVEKIILLLILEWFFVAFQPILNLNFQSAEFSQNFLLISEVFFSNLLISELFSVNHRCIKVHVCTFSDGKKLSVTYHYCNLPLYHAWNFSVWFLNSTSEILLPFCLFSLWLLEFSM